MENNGKDAKKFPAWDLSKKIAVIKNGDEQKVLLEGRPYMSWAYKDRAAERVAIVQLYKSGLATQEELAEAFSIHVNSVYNYTTRFERDGIVSLLYQQSGPKGSWKITPEIKFMILEVAFSNTDISYEGVADLVKKKWNKEISICAIRNVLIENGFRNPLIKKETQEAPMDLFEGKDEGQLMLWDSIDSSEIFDLQDFPEQADQEQIEQVIEDDVPLGGNFKNRILSFYSPAERVYLNRLEKGTFSAYAGGLLFVSLLRQYNFIPIIKRIINIETYEGYTLEQLCLTLLYCDVFGFRSVENFKTVYPEEFGVLIGKTLSPSIFTTRRFLHKVRKLKKGEPLMEEFGKEYLRSGLVKWGVLYIDAHFLPYYGVYIIKMGWHGVRQMPMKGSYNFMAIDDKFNPLIFLIRPSSEDLIKKIPELMLMAKKIAKEVGLPNDRLIIVFDREGYSADLFRKFDSDELNATFISWAKYFDNWKPSIKEEDFNKRVVVDYELQESEEIKYFEAEDRKMNKYGKVRTIVIQSGSKKKQSAIYTNNRELDPELIIKLICRRWGQETLFKTLKLDHRIDYFPGYEPEELEEQPMVENPEVTKLKQKKASLAAKEKRLKAEIGKEILASWGKIKWEDLKEKQKEVLEELVLSDSEKFLIQQEIDKLPQKVRFDEAHNGIKLVKFDYEKKRFLDCIKIFSYTIQKKMCEILSKYYDNPRDIWPTLGMIVRRGADIKLEGNTLTIRLKKFTNEVIEYAARHLCKELNEMSPITLDKFGFQLRYEVE
jgi:transposase